MDHSLLVVPLISYSLHQKSLEFSLRQKDTHPAYVTQTLTTADHSAMRHVTANQYTRTQL